MAQRFGISVSLRGLCEIDGVSPRSARDAHIKLQKYGMIRILKSKPFTYRIEPVPENWEQNFGGRVRLLHVRALRVEKEYY
jgi:hypothetical protein